MEGKRPDAELGERLEIVRRSWREELQLSGKQREWGLMGGKRDKKNLERRPRRIRKALLSTTLL